MGEGMTRRRFLALGVTAVGTVAAGGGLVTAATYAPEAPMESYSMGDGTMKALVVYGTKSGCTEGIAKKIGETLAAAGATVDVRPASEAGSPDGYDAVIVGSGVRAGTWHEAARTWVEANTSALKAVPVALFTCGLTTANAPEKVAEVRAYTDPLLEATGLEPVDVGVFAGWNEPKRFSFVERTIMKLMKAPEGDFRDFDAIAAWTDEVAGKLAAA